MRTLVVVAGLLGGLVAPRVLAQAPAAAPAPQASAQDLETLVGRIALYPDDLIGIILPASTFPLQVVQAERFLQKRKTDPKAPVDENWDDSIKSLLNYPEVVSTMNADLDWTSALGEAVVADQASVLDAIQAFRRKTQAAGNLKSDSKQTVEVDKTTISIAPANPQVIYVPQYNPTTVVVVGGYSSFGYYPAPYPVYYYPYPPGAAFAAGLIWGAAISSAWHGNYYGVRYGGNASINVNRNVNINTGNINVNRPGGGGGGTPWKPSQRPGQVSRPGTATPTRSVENRPGGSALQGATRPSNQRPAGATAAGGSISPTSARGTAFEGYGSGRQTQVDSARGAASRGAAQTAARPTPASRPTGATRPAPHGGGGRGRGR